MPVTRPHAPGGVRFSVPSHAVTCNRQVEFARRFSVDYDRDLPDGSKWKDTPEVVRVRAMCHEYNTRLKDFGLRDYQVCHTHE